MVELLRPVKLDKNLEERLHIGNDEFIVGAHDARFDGNYIKIGIYVAQVKKGKTLLGKPKEKTAKIFDVSVLVGDWEGFDVFLGDLNTKLREYYCKVLNEGFELKPFYDALEKIHSHYVQQGTEAKRIEIEVPAQIATKYK